MCEIKMDGKGDRSQGASMGSGPQDRWPGLENRCVSR